MSLHTPNVFKVLHQSHSIAHYHPKAVQDILWPCLRFAISLQAKADQDLNLFEIALLRLFGEGERDLNIIGHKMGLIDEKGRASSLIEFLSLKLQQLGLVSHRFKLTDEGEQLLDKINSDQTEVISATVYFDLINRYWLPMISRGELKSINVELTSDRFIEFTQGSVGSIEQIRALPLLSKENSSSAPIERDVIDIIKRSRQQNKKLGWGSSHNNHDGFITSRGTISINPDGELVYLHCYAFKGGEGRSYVSDGFRSMIQERFTRAFSSKHYRNNNDSIKAAFESLAQKSCKSYSLPGMRRSKSLENLYQELVEKKVRNSIEQAEYENSLSSFVSKSYYEIERMLAESYDFSKLNNCVFELATDPQENANLAEKIAKKLGFKFEKNKLVNNLLKTNKGRVRHLKADSPEMSALLFSHLIAAQSDDQQPMAKLAIEYPEMLTGVATLRLWRNPVDHGDMSSIRGQIGLEQIKFIYQLIEQIRESLSNWLKSHNNQVPTQSMPNWLKEDIRSRANEQLEEVFGIWLSCMNRAVYQGLFEALLFRDLEDARDRTNALSGALQHAFYQACQSLDSQENRDIESIKRKLSDLGITQLVKSNPHRIKQALGGINTTIGANFIAFLAQITDQQQKDILSPQYQEDIKAIDELDKIRGHSGPILGKHDQLNKIERSAFKLIKLLVEQYCG